MEQRLRAEAVGFVPAVHGAAVGTLARAADATPITLVVPLFNERPRFDRFAPQLVDFIARQPSGSELLFVDDGSTDGTAELVRALQRRDDAHGTHVELLLRPHLGKGAAVRAGLERAHTPVAGFCDLDLSTPLDDFTRLVDAAREAPILAIASRGLAGSRLVRRQGRLRELLGRSFNKAVQVALLPGVTDTQCGAKVARTDLWKSVLAQSREDGFAWDVEIVAIAARFDISVQEIAVEWGHEAQSKVRVLRDGAAMLRALPRIRRRVRQEPALQRDAPSGLARSQRSARVPSRSLDTRAIAALSGADGTHWWFRSKAAMVNWVLERWHATDARLLDLGAGAGGVTAKLGWSPDRAIVVDVNSELVREARVRHALQIVQADLDNVPLTAACVGVVCALDVLEHLDDPAATLREAHRLLEPGGHLIANVPGHPWLWSDSDVVLGHLRRYTRASLRAELEDAGFEVLWCSHVFSWLVAPVWVLRRSLAGVRQLGVDVDSSLVDRAALFLTWAERQLLRHVTLPIGTSVLAIARSRPLRP